MNDQSQMIVQSLTNPLSYVLSSLEHLEHKSGQIGVKVGIIPTSYISLYLNTSTI